MYFFSSNKSKHLKHRMRTILFVKYVYVYFMTLFILRPSFVAITFYVTLFFSFSRSLAFVSFSFFLSFERKSICFAVDNAFFSFALYFSFLVCVFESVCIKADPWIQLIHLHLHVVKTIGLRFEFRFQGMQRQTNEEQTLNDLKQSIQYVVFSLPNSLFEPQPSFIQASSILLGLLSILEHSKGWPK